MSNLICFSEQARKCTPDFLILHREFGGKYTNLYVGFDTLHKKYGVHFGISIAFLKIFVKIKYSQIRQNSKDYVRDKFFRRNNIS